MASIQVPSGDSKFSIIKKNQSPSKVARSTHSSKPSSKPFLYQSLSDYDWARTAVRACSLGSSLRVWVKLPIARDHAPSLPFWHRMILKPPRILELIQLLYIRRASPQVSIYGTHPTPKATS
ncbi:hypothetical protein VTO42DRAFT_5659 [Malbranchea cinnamomea]